MTTNLDRAYRAEAIVTRYFEDYEDEGEDTATVLSDLLADLMHYTRRQFPRQWSKAWADILDRAEYHFEAERVQGWDRETHA
jgi:hypothetical protein